MAKMEDGGSAFPQSFSGHCGNSDHSDPCGCYMDNGMSLRDFFAAAALAGLLAGNSFGASSNLGEMAYKHADYMLRARPK